MKPGREIDILIAEKVMGYNLTRYDVSWYESGNLRIEIVKSLAKAMELAEEKKGRILNFKSYSTDIEAAWEVVNKCIGLREYFQFKITNYAVRNEWTAHLEIHNDNLPSYELSASGETAPHAICLAALKTVVKK
jgi:hypothetical protein